MTYEEKLNDPRWKAQVVEIKELKGDRCAQCRSEEEIHIHHMAYTTADPWDEPNHHLIPLCECCHTSEHCKIDSGWKIDLNEAAMLGGFTPMEMRRIEDALSVKKAII